LKDKIELENLKMNLTQYTDNEFVIAGVNLFISEYSATFSSFLKYPISLGTSSEIKDIIDNLKYKDNQAIKENLEAYYTFSVVLGYYFGESKLNDSDELLIKAKLLMISEEFNIIWNELDEFSWDKVYLNVKVLAYVFDMVLRFNIGLEYYNLI